MIMKIMKLTKKQATGLKKIDIVKTTHKAREESNRLLNDQGFVILSVAVSRFIADIVEHPERLIKELPIESIS
jgi:hypothetical protein